MAVVLQVSVLQLKQSLSEIIHGKFCYIVHLSTGAAALAFAYMVGNRKDPTEKPPHNMTNVVLGTSFIWFGWLVANAGSGISPNLRAVTVFVTTNISASMGEAIICHLIIFNTSYVVQNFSIFF